MRPVVVLRPMAGSASPMAAKMMYIATMASKAGKNVVSSSAIMPGRRPLNRSREKAKAASAPRKTAASAPTSEMTIEFLYQVQNGRELSLKRSVKFFVEKPDGHRLAVLSVPLGLVAAE